jgi:CelD/BcsL family acetyltransferase involved in cellulose biosynthesis
MRDLQLRGRTLGFLRVLAPIRLKISDPRGGDSPTLGCDGLVARCDRAWPADSQFLQQWNALLARTPDATVFNSPGWQQAVTDYFVRPGRLRIVTVRRGDALLAVFPLALHAASVLETPGKWVSDYLDPLVDPAAARQCWPLILDLLNDLWDWSTRGLVFHNIPDTSSIRSILKAIAPDYEFEYQETVVDSAPYLLLPDTWEKYLDTLSSKQRRNQKKNLRTAETDAKARWLTLNTMDQITPALERGVAGLCQAEGSKGRFSRAYLSGFLRRVVPAIVAQGDFYMHELWMQGKPAAWHFMLRSRDGPMGYNAAFDASLRDLSPGSTSFAMAIRSAIEGKSPKYNFLRGSEEFKIRLGCKSIDLLKISLIRKYFGSARNGGPVRRPQAINVSTAPPK